MTWWRMPFAVLDVETTGLEPFTNRVIELGVARFEDGRRVWAGSRLIHPGFDPRTIDPKIFEITKIDPRQLLDAPPFWEVFNELGPLLYDAIPVAYNAPFDKRFFLLEVTKFWPRSAFHTLPSVLSFETPWIDPCQLARSYLDLYGYRLTDVNRALGLPKREAHAAEDDAIMAGEILVALATTRQPSVADVLDRQRQARGKRVLEKDIPKAGGPMPVGGKHQLFECDICHDVVHTLDGKRPSDWAYFDRNLTTCGPACDIIAGWSRGRW